MVGPENKIKKYLKLHPPDVDPNMEFEEPTLEEVSNGLKADGLIVPEQDDDSKVQSTP